MMAKEIVDELTPITKELRELNDKAAAARQKQLASDSSMAGVKRDIDSQPRSKQRRVYGPLAESFLQKYMDHKKSQIDTTFGIRYEDGDWTIGNKRIKINGDDITIDVEVYDGNVNSTTMRTWSGIKNFSTRRVLCINTITRTNLIQERVVERNGLKI